MTRRPPHACRAASASYHYRGRHRRVAFVDRRRHLATRSSGGDRRDREYGGGNDGRRAFQLDAFPFTVRPREAYSKFVNWSNDEQGLRHLLSLSSMYGGASPRISASYAPYWYFTMNVRFVPPPFSGGGWKDPSMVVPEPLRSAYTHPPGGVLHLPGLASYSGYSYRRSLIDRVHNTTPLFLGGDIVPFRRWMLEPLEYDDGIRLEIYPDPWNATRERAYSVICDELRDMANAQYRERTGTSSSSLGDGDFVGVETERLAARRIYMPTYVIDYTVLGISYRAVISGCDPSMRVSGVSHRMTPFAPDDNAMGPTAQDGRGGASSFLSNIHRRVAPAAAGIFQLFGPRPFVVVARAVLTVLSRIALKVPMIGMVGGGLYVAYGKLIRPYMDDRAATAEWEGRRDRESSRGDGGASTSVHEDSFKDDGAAKAYFVANEARILSSLGRMEGRRDDDNSGAGEGPEWYEQWEAWARQQWEKAQREASRAHEEFMRQQQRRGRADNRYEQTGQRQRQRQQQQQARQGQRQYKQAKKDDDYHWDFDVNDPWSVLGVPRNSSKEEVSKAFRREMLKHHPDLQSQNSEKEKGRATERTKIISDAYRKIKAGHGKG